MLRKTPGFTTSHYSKCFDFRLLAEAPGFKDLVNQFSADYCTALYYAVIAYHTDIIKLLLEKGAKEAINAQDWDGKTALHMAASMPASL